jgi:hypothetical protein
MVSRGEGVGKPAPSAININKPCKDINTNGGGRWVSFLKGQTPHKKMKEILLSLYKLGIFEKVV